MAICYRDRTFCNSDCVNLTCDRLLTDEVKDAAAKWAAGWTDDVPIATSDFSGSCAGYAAPNNHAILG